MSIDFTAQAARQQTARLSADAAAYLTGRGYTRLETDIIQPADLFLTRAGDQIITRLFTFDRRGQTLALRPEFTAIAAAAYARQLAEVTPPVVRWQFHGPVFEDAPETGQIAQSYSIGAELIGDSALTADAEILQLAHGALTTAGVPGVRVVIGSVALLRALLDLFGLDSRTIRFLLTRLDDLADPAGRAHVIAQLDRLLGTAAASAVSADWVRLVETAEPAPALGGRTQADIARRLAQKRQRIAERDQISAALDFLSAWVAIDAPAAEAWPQITALIEAMNEAMNAHTPAVTAALTDWRAVLDVIEPTLPPGTIRLKPGLERSWDYYTGLVFELRSAAGVLLGGGGRYDELVRLLGAPVDVPAVGFACAAEAAAALREGTGQ